MVHIAFDLNEGALAGVRQDQETFTRELRLAAAIKWYEMRRLSQGRAAEIAGVSRGEFIDALGRYGVSPFQQTVDELVSEVGRLALLERDGFARLIPDPVRDEVCAGAADDPA